MIDHFFHLKLTVINYERKNNMKSIFRRLLGTEPQFTKEMEAALVKEGKELGQKTKGEMEDCMVKYLTEKSNLNGELQQCIKTSPDDQSRDRCVKERVERYLSNKTKRSECMNNAFLRLQENIHASAERFAEQFSEDENGFSMPG